MSRILPLALLLTAALPACAGPGGPSESAAPSPDVQPCTYPHGTALTHLPDGRTVAEAFASAARDAARDPWESRAYGVPGASEPTLANRQDVARAIARRYPPQLSEQGKTGAVSLFVLITAEGRVGDVRILRPAGEPAFDSAALQVAPEMRFHPARVGACAVPAFATIPVTFSIETEIGFRSGP